MPRDFRTAHNQAVFREVNEHMVDLSRGRFASPLPTATFCCECNRIGCTTMIEVPLQVYARAREDPATYLVQADHRDRDHEQTLEDFGDYMLVRTSLDQLDDREPTRSGSP